MPGFNPKPERSHRVLWVNLAPGATPEAPASQARRLLRRFVELAIGRSLPEETLQPFDGLAQERLEKGIPFQEALMSAYQAFLSSAHFLYLREPGSSAYSFAIASRLSHFLTNQRPDEPLLQAARQDALRSPSTLRAQALRLLDGPHFPASVEDFTDSWLALRHLQREVTALDRTRLDQYFTSIREVEERLQANRQWEVTPKPGSPIPGECG